MFVHASPIYRIFLSFVALASLILFLPLLIGAAIVGGLVALTTTIFLSRQLVVREPLVAERRQTHPVAAPPESDVIDTTWTRID